MFDLGQLGLLPFNARDEASIYEAVKHSDIVVNMVGKHFETKHALPRKDAHGKTSRINYSFEEVHAEVPGRIARIAKEAGVQGFVQVSSLNAHDKSPSLWNQSKYHGELAVAREFPGAVCVKLSTVFGPEDRFLNWLAEATMRLPAVPLVEGGSNLVQPVYAADVGKGIMEIIRNYEDFQGRSFQFVGPH
eukprot:gene14536-17751_t